MAIECNFFIAEVVMWRAHTQRISSVMLVNRWNTVITGSVDGAVRLWTLKGQYIGEFETLQGNGTVSSGAQYG